MLVLTIDEQGMAKTAERKLEVAQRIYDIAVNEHGLRPQALVFDTLTFTLATGDAEFANSAIETLEGIRLIKAELPGVLTSLGVSNVSFGLAPAARPVLNSVMLYHAVQAGLDMAIVNPAQITPYAEIPAEERAADRGPDLQPPPGCPAALHRVFRARVASPPARSRARPIRPQDMTPAAAPALAHPAPPQGRRGGGYRRDPGSPTAASAPTSTRRPSTS